MMKVAMVKMAVAGFATIACAASCVSQRVETAAGNQPVESSQIPAGTGADSLESQLALLRRQSVAEVGRDHLVEKYEQLINRAGSDPVAIRAMLDVAGIYKSLSIPAQGIKQDPKAAYRWYERATLLAKPRSREATEAKLNLARLLIAENKAGDARRILDGLASEMDSDPVTPVRIEAEYMASYGRDGNAEAAELHARTVLSWYGKAQSVPRDAGKKAEIDAQMQSAGGYAVSLWSRADMPVEIRTAHIQKLMQDYPFLDAVQEYGRQALGESTGRGHAEQ